MGRRLKAQNDRRMAQQIEHWFYEAHRMWMGAHKTIRKVKRVQEKLIEQSRTVGSTHRVAPWVEE